MQIIQLQTLQFTQPNNEGALKLPSYGLLDLGLSYQIGNGLSFRANVNNLLDTEYISESNTNIHATSGSTTWNGVDVNNSVWFGFGNYLECFIEVQILVFYYKYIKNPALAGFFYGVNSYI